MHGRWPGGGKRRLDSARPRGGSTGGAKAGGLPPSQGPRALPPRPCPRPLPSAARALAARPCQPTAAGGRFPLGVPQWRSSPRRAGPPASGAAPPACMPGPGWPPPADAARTQRRSLAGEGRGRRRVRPLTSSNRDRGLPRYRRRAAGTSAHLPTPRRYARQPSHAQHARAGAAAPCSEHAGRPAAAGLPPARPPLPRTGHEPSAGRRRLSAGSRGAW